MLLQAAEEHGFELNRCWIVGDSSSDIEAGLRAGCRTARITPVTEHAKIEPVPDLIAVDLSLAAEQILRRECVAGREISWTAHLRTR
jgi:D-glycero-D-manno-heptose 1,7-bisphosphate phosphatase